MRAPVSFLQAASFPWRLRVAVFLSLLLHALFLSLSIGGASFGLPGLRFPWEERRLAAHELQVVLAPPPAIAAAPVSLPAPAAIPVLPKPSAPTPPAIPERPPTATVIAAAPPQPVEVRAKQEDAEALAQARIAAEQLEAARVDAERQALARQEAARAEAARLEAARKEEMQQAQLAAQRQEQLRQESMRREREQAEAARMEAERVEAERQEQLRQAQREAAQKEQARQEQARQEQARQEQAKQEQARQDIAKREQAQRERAEQEAKREERLRAIGRQLDQEAAAREAANGAPSGVLRRKWLFGKADPDADLIGYAQAMGRKIEMNTGVREVRDLAKLPHVRPVVTVAVRADGSVEKVTFVTSSGVAAIDEAVRKYVTGQAPYGPFPPSLARQYDVVEIRRTWVFDVAIRLE